MVAAGPTMRNLIFGTIVLSALAYGGAKFYLHNEVSNAMDNAVLMATPFAKVDYDGVSSTLSGELTVDGLVVRVQGYRDEITIDRIGIDTPSFLSLLELSDFMSLQSSGIPDELGFLVEGLRIPVDADYYKDLYDFMLAARQVDDASDPAVECTGRYGFSPKTLAALGYKEQVLSMTMGVRDDGSRYSFDLDISMDDMWDVEASVSLAGNMMAELSRGMMYQPRLRDLRIAYMDRSLNERVAKYCEERGLSPVEVLRAQLDSFKYVGESNGIVFDEYLIEPYKEFLAGKSTLVVTARPSEPIAFSQIDLYKPSDVPALLNLSAMAQ